MKKTIRLFFSFGLFILLIRPSYAIPPPDFIFNVGSQLVQIFAVVAIFATTLFASMHQFIKIFFSKIKLPKWLLFFSITVLLISSFAIAYGIDQYKQNKAFEEWKKRSNEYIQLDKDGNLDTFDNSEYSITTDNQNPTGELVEEELIEPDEYETFIRKLYSDIETGNFESAYEVGTKKYSFEVFKNLYINVENIDVNSIKKISDNVYEVVVVLDEDDKLTTYIVMMTLEKNTSGQIYTTNSTSEVISEISKTEYKSSYITNTNFQKLLDSDSTIFVLDAREDEEYNIGKFPGSTHIRFADLKAGQWESLPKNEEIYVLCWSGIRGKETADFLVSKGLKAIYLEEGADSWVTFGGIWEGEIKFSSYYKDERYRKLLTLAEVKNEIAKGTIIIDSREKNRYNSWHIPDSINISVINTPSTEIDSLLKLIPSNSTIITVCDDVVNCFDARVTGVKAENQGHTFLGRYNKPWEYRGSI